MTENKENQKNGLQFTFRKRYRKVDWKLLGCVDVERIAAELDYHALQKNIMNVAFCDTMSQDFLQCDPDFIKLYRLGQYTIEYLLHCQEFLSHSGAVLEDKLREAVKFRNEVKDKLETKQRELTEAKKESRKRKKMIAVYQGMMSASGANGFHKCSECEKAFVSSSFLESHLERRHNITLGAAGAGTGGVSLDKLKIRCEELQSEVESKGKQYTELEGERVKAQEQCDRALALRDSSLAQQQQLELQYNQWKKEERERHKGEVASLQSVYNKQVNEVLEEKRVAELALVEAKRGIVSNLGALRDEEHEHDDLRQEQIMELEKQFDFKIAQLQQEVEQQARRLRDSEECRVKGEEEAQRREDKLRAQLDKRGEEEVKLKEILSNLEHENAKLQRLCTENAAVETLYSPRAMLDRESEHNVEVTQQIIASQPVDIVTKVPVPREPSPEPVYTPFKDKPYITCQYNHPTETLADVRRRAEHELQNKLKEITGARSVTKLCDEDYALHQVQLRQDRDQHHEQRRSRLEDELSELAQSPTPGPHSALPPKSPSVRKATAQSSSSKRQKTSPPLAPAVPAAPLPVPAAPLPVPSLDKERELSPLDNVDSFTASTPVQYRKERPASPRPVSPGQEAPHIGHASPVESPVESEYDSDELSESEDEEVFPGEDELAKFQAELAAEGNEPSWLESTGSVVSELDIGESVHSVKDYYKAASYNDFDEEESYGVEYQAEEEPEIHTAVKMRPKKAKSKDIEEEESIFSFDGWSKNKARNSMSVADAKEAIPMGHVERMRHEVDTKNKSRTKHLSVGVSIMGDSPSIDDKRHSEPCRRAVDEDDFTISSISDIDLSPVGMSVEVKKRGDVSDEDF